MNLEMNIYPRQNLTRLNFEVNKLKPCLCYITWKLI